MVRKEGGIRSYGCVSVIPWETEFYLRIWEEDCFNMEVATLRDSTASPLTAPQLQGWEGLTQAHTETLTLCSWTQTLAWKG